MSDKTRLWQEQSGEFDDPHNRPTVPWDGDTLHFMGGECAEVRFGYGKTLVYLHNPQRPRSGSVCPCPENARALGRELARRWNARQALKAIAATRVDDRTDYKELCALLVATAQIALSDKPEDDKDALNQMQASAR